jgi:hypothetical protein
MIVYRTFAALLLIALTFASGSVAARAADDVNVGMLRLPTALFIGIDQG